MADKFKEAGLWGIALLHKDGSVDSINPHRVGFDRNHAIKRLNDAYEDDNRYAKGERLGYIKAVELYTKEER